jgi:hypothetical protein
MHPEYSGFIIVQLADWNEDTVRTQRDLTAAWRIEARPLITSIPQSELFRADNGNVTESLALYWRLDGRGKPPAELERLAETLKAKPEIADAYPEWAPDSPTSSVATIADPYEQYQTYLKPAPRGIDAHHAWRLLRCQAQHWRAQFIDLEHGWHTDHEDLPQDLMHTLYGVPADMSPKERDKDHGTAVVAIVMAIHLNDKGIKGIGSSGTPLNQNTWSIASHHRNGTSGHVANAITAVRLSKDVRRGAILLLEVTRYGLPTERDPADRKAIRAASEKGIVVVECAGNGNKNLDQELPAGVDSRAIMVGASMWREERHHRLVTPNGEAGSNYGQRVDCFAVGEGVVTAGFGSLDPGTGPHDRYTNTFGGTSGAGAIIAGVALLIQNIRQINGKKPLSPLAMRRILRRYGTTSVPPGEPIGRMPDMRKSIEAALAVP